MVRPNIAPQPKPRNNERSRSTSLPRKDHDSLVASDAQQLDNTLATMLDDLALCSRG